PGRDADATAAEAGPADDLFEGQSAGPALDQPGGLPRVARGGEDQVRLVLGEDAAGGPEHARHGVPRQGRGRRRVFGRRGGAGGSRGREQGGGGRVRRRGGRIGGRWSRRGCGRRAGGGGRRGRG